MSLWKNVIVWKRLRGKEKTRGRFRKAFEAAKSVGRSESGAVPWSGSRQLSHPASACVDDIYISIKIDTLNDV